MQELLKVFDINVLDRKGVWTWIWIVYHKSRVITVEFTRTKSGFTDRVDLQDAI